MITNLLRIPIIKYLIVIVCICLIGLTIVPSLGILYHNEYNNAIEDSGSLSSENKVPKPRPPKLYEIVPPITLDEYLRNVIPILEKYNAKLKLPTWMPDHVKPIKVWFRWGCAIIGIIAYDNHDVENYDKAKIRLGIHIWLKYRPPPQINITKGIRDFIYEREKGNVESFRRDGINASFMEINNMIVVALKFKNGEYYVYAFDIYNEVVIKYGIVAGKEYRLSDLLKIIESMKPV